MKKTNNGKSLEIKKIPLQGFIDMLVELYNNGVDFVNMTVEKGDHQDSIWLTDEEQEEITPKEEKKLELKNVVDFNELI